MTRPMSFGLVAPSSALANSKTYTVSITGGSSGVKDLAGNALVSNVTSSFTTAAVGVSGAPGGDMDEACAKAGVAAIKEKLDF